MKRLILLFSALWLLSPATELTDLGQGLSYLRIHSVADSEVALRKVVPGAGALVLETEDAARARGAMLPVCTTMRSRAAGAMSPARNRRRA